MINYIIIGVLANISIIALISKKLSGKKQPFCIEIIKNFNSYIEVLNYHLDKAFEIIYKDRILIYSIEGVKVKERDIDIISKDYCNLVFRMLGETLTNQFILLYGNKETLIFNILDYFNKKYEEDSIRDTAVNNLSNSEEQT